MLKQAIAGCCIRRETRSPQLCVDELEVPIGNSVRRPGVMKFAARKRKRSTPRPTTRDQKSAVLLLYRAPLSSRLS